MKKVLLTSICMLTTLSWSANANAQTTTTITDGSHSATIAKNEDGSKITITADGNLTDLECKNGEKTFTESAVNNVYVDVNGTKTSVKSGDKYTIGTTYYQASRNYTEYTITSDNKVEKNVFSFTQKAFDAPLYVYSNNHNDWKYLYKEVTKGDTPYHAGGYTMTYNNNDNINKSWDNYSYFYVENGDSYKNLSTEELLEEGYVNQAIQPVLQGLTNNVYMSTDGGQTYTLVLNGDVYNENATYYTGGETTYSELAKADTYVTDVIVPFSEYLPTLLEGVTSATFNSVDKNNPSMIDNSIVWAVVNSKVRILDMSGVKIEKIETPFDNEDMSSISTNKGTFTLGNPNNLWWKNNYLETLYTPQVNNGGELKWNVFGFLTKLRYLHLSEGIETLGSKALIKNEIKLSALTFPSSLKYIKEYACSGHYATGNGGIIPNKVYDEATEEYDKKDADWIQTLVFPAGLKEIDTNAFAGTCPKDVYFLGEEAPKVAIYAWGDNAYISNNAFSPSIIDGTDNATSVKVDIAEGHACRNNYIAQSGWQTMLHYPSTCTKAQAAKYTDITRDYRIVGTGDEKLGVDRYTPAQETTDLKVKPNYGSVLGISAPKSFTRDFDDAWDRGRYSGGYPDMYTGEQYLWPSMAMAQRATIIAQNNVLWNGVTTIGEGIKQYDDTYTGDGSEYIGLHQFILAKADADSKSTPEEFPMDKYADGEWHTICLPFDITKGQMKEIFGRAEDDVNEEYNNIRLCKFSHVIRVVGENSHLKLCFNDEQFHKKGLTDNDVVLQAHVSYMIKAKKENAVEGEKIVMKGYEMKPGNPIPTNIYGTAKGGNMNPMDDEEEKFSYRFIGTYLPNVCMPQYSYFFSKTKKLFRFQTGNKGKWNPYTSVIEAPLGADDNEIFFDGNTTNAKLATGLDEIEDETTGVEKITIEAAGDVIYTNDNVYNLNGQLVSKNGTHGLPKGIYVVSGKKVMIK